MYQVELCPGSPILELCAAHCYSPQALPITHVHIGTCAADKEESMRKMFNVCFTTVFLKPTVNPFVTGRDSLNCRHKM